MSASVAARHGATQTEPNKASLNLQVLLCLVGMVTLWTLLCAISHRAPDLDGMEELVWASSLELGYTKHPPVPSWFMYGLTQIFGRPIWLTFFAGQLFSALALWFVWLLACEITTPRKAFIITLFASTNIYFSLRGTIYNHNTVQLWSIVGATWLFYRALRYQKNSSWIWLGAISAIATMTKYSAFIQFAAFFCFMLRQGSFKDKRTLKGLALSFAAFAVVVSPHVYWLGIHAFEPLRYADNALETNSYIDSLKHILDFTLDQAARLSPMLILLLAWWYGQRKNTKAATGDKQRYVSDISKWDRSFLLWVGLTPFVSTVLLSALLGTRLQASWATTFFVLYGFYTLWLMYGDEQSNLRRILILAVSLHVLMAVGYAIGRGPLAWYSGRETRSMFPGAIIATEMNKIWDQHVPQSPLRLVASDTWMGGNVAVHSGPKVQVLIDGRYNESPWLDPETALDCGALVVFSRVSKDEPAPSLQKLFDKGRWQGTASVPWSSAKSRDIDLNWAIIEPNPTCAATR